MDVSIEIDAQKNILRAIATGSTELRKKDLGTSKLSQEELKKISAEALITSVKNVNIVASAGR